MGVVSHAFQVHQGQDIADCLSTCKKKIPALSHCNSTAEEYVRMAVISATLHALTAREKGEHWLRTRN